ncbi:hypothetical protein CLU79DRAFT_758767 [Phycomyces nitens]|nr:hypothetical protein CLU79DRAFT_758767 [Phycomyces nitens]
MSSIKGDPRRPDKIVPFHQAPKNEEEADFTSNIAMFTAMGGIMMRNQFKIIPWIASYFGLSAFLNKRTSLKTGDGLADSGSLVAFVSLFTYYLNVYMLNRNTIQALVDSPQDTLD